MIFLCFSIRKLTKNTRWRVLSVNPVPATRASPVMPRRTLPEADLQRRDLTINALARDDAGQIIDPTTGAGIWRHVYCAMSLPRLAKILARIARGAFCCPLRSS